MGQLIYPRLSADTYVLPTFLSRYDGLSYVASRLIDNCTMVQRAATGGARRTILVPGIPHHYLRLLDPRDLNVCYTTYETDCLPETWTDALNRHYHGCIVPHPAVKRAFRRSGVRIPLFVAHQGYTRLPRPASGHSAPDLGFTVGFLGVPKGRKNLHALFEACRALIDEGLIPDLKLQVHVPTYYAEIDSERFAAIRRARFVIYSEGRKTEAQLAAWYAGLSAYCFPSSGEGWSFTPRESLYLGVPTILSDVPVHRELLRAGFCQPIRHRGLKQALQEHFEDGRRSHLPCGRWHDIAAADIGQSILEVYRHYPAFLQRAAVGSRWIAGKWANENSLQRVRRILATIAGASVPRPGQPLV